MTICCFFYNISHLFELQSIPCIDERFNLESLQICPTEFRMNSLYYTIYYTYMYTTFIAVGPLLLLIVLNICIVINVLTKGADGMSIFLLFFKNGDIIVWADRTFSGDVGIFLFKKLFIGQF
jgi:hypothetical protein